jgi:hypothetical protein
LRKADFRNEANVIGRFFSARRSSARRDTPPDNLREVVEVARELDIEAEPQWDTKPQRSWGAAVWVGDAGLGGDGRPVESGGG